MNKIKFTARSKTDFETQIKPFPASQAVPNWWKEMPPYAITDDNPDGKKIIVRYRESNATAKKCTPMLDSIVSGYIIPLWADVQVTQIDGQPSVTWRTHKEVFTVHGNYSIPHIPAPPGYERIVLKYNNCWIPKTPKGYSVMVTAPAGYQDLPFKAIPAVVDTDRSELELVFPMWIKKDFEGIVEHGTPMVQITPFKREDWKAEFDYYKDGEYFNVIEERNFNKTLVNNYIKNHWSKKTYK